MAVHKTKNNKEQSIVEDAEKFECMCIAGGNVNGPVLWKTVW